MRALCVGPLAALALVAGGCGAKDKAAARAAEIVPANAPVLITVDTDVDGGQWRQLEELVRRFPDGVRAIALLRASFEEDTNLRWGQDVKPALGDEISLVWLDFAAGGENVVALTQPSDEAKFRAAIEKGNASDEAGEEGDDLVVGETGDWLVLSDAQAKVDRFVRSAESGKKLADDAGYQDAIEGLSADALAVAYARGQALADALDAAVPGASVFPPSAGGRPEVVAAALEATDDGFHASARYRTERDPQPAPELYESKLLDDVPADAIGFMTFRGGEALGRQLGDLERSDPSYRQALRMLETEFGFRFDRITRLFTNEVALYLRRGTPFPELTFLLEAPDEQQALGAVDDLFQAVTKNAPVQPCHAPQEEAGVRVKCVDFGTGFRVTYGAFDGKVVVTTGVNAIEELRSRGPRLGDAEAFKDALESAGAPDRHSGLVWLDTKSIVPMLLGLAGAASEAVPPEVQRNLRPLQALVAWSTVEGRTSEAELFLEID